MKDELVTMSAPELDRLSVVKRVLEKRLTQRLGAQILGLSVRQLQRLIVRYERDGPSGLVSRKRGRASNRELSAEFRTQVLELIAAKYWDFGPTLAREKLAEHHGLKVGRETLRRWMTTAEIWLPRAQRRHIHQPRRRRECIGELIQIDGSDHEWFEDRGPRCTLLVYIDDATSKLMLLRFVRSESAFDYFDATKDYVATHGKPIAFYSDKHSIFRVADKKSRETAGMTQFGRALSDLNIDIICANTPQAKGRVERANRTLQDRLVKELRLAGISDMAGANRFIDGFVEDFNRRFEKPALRGHDAHRPVREDEDLDQIFTWQERRKITKDLVVHYKHRNLHIPVSPATKPLAGRTCTIREWSDGRLELVHKGVVVPYSVFDKLQRVTQAAIVDNKRLGAALEFARQRQNERDRERLENPKITLREKDRIEAQMRR